MAAHERVVQVGVGDAALVMQCTESALGQRSSCSVQVARTADGLFERHTEHAAERVDRDEGLQRVVGGNHPGSQSDVAA